MTAASRLCALHLRLTLDHATPFTGGGTGPRITVHPTTAGLAWLRDHATYRRIWRQLERAGHAPATVLKHEFGYVLESEIPPEPEET